MPAQRVFILLTLIFLPILTGCAITEEQEVQMGIQAAPKFEKEFGGLYPDQQVQRYVSDVGMSMVRYSERQDLPWEFSVLDSKEINAFALPGGKIYITRGLLGQLRNEAQLAAVLGHEIGHVEHRHSAEQIERTQLAQGGSMIAGVIGSVVGVGGVGDVAGLVSGLTLMRYSRGQEREADDAGLQYIVRAGYEPLAMVETMEVLRKASKGGGRAPDFLSTHPSPEDRAEDLEERIEEAYATRRGRTGREEFEENVLRRLR